MRCIVSFFFFDLDVGTSVWMVGSGVVAESNRESGLWASLWGV
jgi:hypothetical protein